MNVMGRGGGHNDHEARVKIAGVKPRARIIPTTMSESRRTYIVTSSIKTSGIVTSRNVA